MQFTAELPVSENIYAAPQASFNEQLSSSAEQRFYLVSERKMLVLFFLTVGLYQVYWDYVNWRNYRDASGEDVWPLPRAIFSIFFTHSLFRHISDHDATGSRASWNNSACATGIVFLLIAGRILDRLSWNGIGSPFTDIASLLLLVPLGLLLKQVQHEINARCGDAEGAANDRFTGANIAWCVIGGLFWCLCLVGIFVEA